MEDVPEQPVDAEDEDPGWPVGFLILTGLAALYLLVRFVQLGARFLEWLG